MAKADFQGSKSCGMWWCVTVSGHDVLQEPCSSHQELFTQQNSDTHQITCILSNTVFRTSNLSHTILPEVSSVNSCFLFTNSHTSNKVSSLVLQDSQNYECDNKNLWVLACFKFRDLLSGTTGLWSPGRDSAPLNNQFLIFQENVTSRSTNNSSSLTLNPWR